MVRVKSVDSVFSRNKISPNLTLHVSGYDSSSDRHCSTVSVPDPRMLQRSMY